MDTSLKKSLVIFKKRKIPEDIQLRFLKRLSRLLIEGYSMIDALEVLKWDKHMVTVADEVIESLKNGATLDQALELSEFHATITNYLYFVRSNGNIQENIAKCIAMYEERLKYRQKFQEIARYPIILLIVFSILLYFIKTSVLPSFSQLFQSNPDASQTINLFTTLIEYSVIVIFSCFVFGCIWAVFWYFYKNTVSIQHKIKIYNRIPIYRKYILLQVSFQFSMYLSTMLKSGIALKEILISMSQQSKQPIISYYASLMTRELSLGLSIAPLLLELDFLDKRIPFIFRKNTDVKALEKDLSVYGDLLTDELERKTMKALTLIQPIIFIILAFFVIFIYLTLMLPMYQIIKTI